MVYEDCRLNVPCLCRTMRGGSIRLSAWTCDAQAEREKDDAYYDGREQGRTPPVYQRNLCQPVCGVGLALNILDQSGHQE